MICSGGASAVEGGDDLIKFDFDYAAALAEGYTEYIEVRFNASVYVQVTPTPPTTGLIPHTLAKYIWTP